MAIYLVKSEITRYFTPEAKYWQRDVNVELIEIVPGVEFSPTRAAFIASDDDLGNVVEFALTYADDTGDILNLPKTGEKDGRYYYSCHWKMLKMVSTDGNPGPQPSPTPTPTPTNNVEEPIDDYIYDSMEAVSIIGTTNGTSGSAAGLNDRNLVSIQGVNGVTGLSLENDIVTLTESGRYYIKARSGSYAAGKTSTIIYFISGDYADTSFEGPKRYCDTNTADVKTTESSVVVDITQTTKLKIQTYCTSGKSGNGLFNGGASTLFVQKLASADGGSSSGGSSSSGGIGDLPEIVAQSNFGSKIPDIILLHPSQAGSGDPRAYYFFGIDASEDAIIYRIDGDSTTQIVFTNNSTGDYDADLTNTTHVRYDGDTTLQSIIDNNRAVYHGGGSSSSGSSSSSGGISAWGVFDGTEGSGDDTTLTLQAGENVASVKRVSTGRYLVTMTEPMPSEYYSVAISCDPNNSGGSYGGVSDYFTPITTTQFEIETRTSTNTYNNSDRISFHVVGAVSSGSSSSGGSSSGGSSSSGVGSLDVIKNDLENFAHVVPDAIVVHEAHNRWVVVQLMTIDSSGDGSEFYQPYDIFYRNGSGTPYVGFKDTTDGDPAGGIEISGVHSSETSWKLKDYIDNDRAIYYGGGSSSGGSDGGSSSGGVEIGNAEAFASRSNFNGTLPSFIYTTHGTYTCALILTDVNETAANNAPTGRIYYRYPYENWWLEFANNSEGTALADHGLSHQSVNGSQLSSLQAYIDNGYATFLGSGGTSSSSGSSSSSGHPKLQEASDFGGIIPDRIIVNNGQNQPCTFRLYGVQPNVGTAINTIVYRDNYGNNNSLTFQNDTTGTSPTFSNNAWSFFETTNSLQDVIDTGYAIFDMNGSSQSASASELDIPQQNSGISDYIQYSLITPTDSTTQSVSKTDIDNTNDYTYYSL